MAKSSKKYRFKFLKAGTYQRKDGRETSVFTAGAVMTGGYQEFKKHADIEVTKIGEPDAPQAPKSESES